MAVMRNVFCTHADGSGSCLKKPKLWGIFRRTCEEWNSIGVGNCKIATRPRKPDIQPVSRTPRKRRIETSPIVMKKGKKGGSRVIRF